MNGTSKRLIADGRPHECRHPLGDGGVQITTFVPLRFKKRGIKKVIVPPEGAGEAEIFHTQAIAPLHDSVLLRALGRGHYWQHLLDSGSVVDTAEISEREGIYRATVSEVLRLALLSPEIAEAAIDGSLPRTVSLERLLRTTFPLDWGKQRELIGGLGEALPGEPRQTRLAGLWRRT